jgi:hypothetical protein
VTAFIAGYLAVGTVAAFVLGPVMGRRSREMHEQMQWKDADAAGVIVADRRREETLLDKAIGWALLIGVLVLGAIAIVGSIQ